MKKFLLLIAFCLLFVTAGCGGSGKNEKPDETNDTDDASCVSDEANDTGNETNDTDNETTGDTDNETNDGDTAGECEENATRADCAEGIYSRCNGGRWEKAECPNGASCTTDGTCGECKDGDSTKCEDSDSGKGSAIFCKEGVWATKKTICPGEFSCSMEATCYDCLNKCDTEWTCDANCEDCEEDCKKNAECKAECGECDSKCGECLNKSNKNCKEDSNGIGITDFCTNGTWSEKNCSAVRGINVSCSKYCPDDTESCGESEKKSRCGYCPNTNGNHLCLTHGMSYGYELPANVLEALASCENGYITDVTPCKQHTCNPENGACEPDVTY